MNKEAVFGRAAITVIKAEKSQGDIISKPKSGMEYIIVTIKERNVAKEEFSLDYNPFYFKVQNSQGQINGPAITAIDSDTSMNSGQLAMGGEVTGTVAFEVPKDDPDLTLLFTPEGSPLLKYKISAELPAEVSQTNKD